MILSHENMFPMLKILKYEVDASKRLSISDLGDIGLYTMTTGKLPIPFGANCRFSKNAYTPAPFHKSTFYIGEKTFLGVLMALFVDHYNDRHLKFIGFLKSLFYIWARKVLPCHRCSSAAYFCAAVTQKAGKT